MSKFCFRKNKKNVQFWGCELSLLTVKEQREDSQMTIRGQLEHIQRIVIRQFKKDDDDMIVKGQKRRVVH